MPTWTTEEEIVLLYYASRRVKNATIIDILAKKCGPKVRTVKQIAHKTTRLRAKCDQKEVVRVGTWPAPDRIWDCKLVDRWLFSKMKKAQLERLLEFDGETAAIIGESSDLDDFVDMMLLHDEEMTDQPEQTDQSQKSEQREQHIDRIDP